MKRFKTPAFTLVEILVVLAIIGIMTAMVTTAVQGVTSTARIARTRTIIATVDSVIQEQYESYKYRPLPVSIPDFSQPGQSRTDYETANETTSHLVVDFEILPSESARIRLNMLRDLQRMEMPDRVADVRVGTSLVSPAAIRGVANRVVQNKTTGELSRSNVRTERVQLPISWYGSTNLSDAQDVPSKLATYFERSGSGWTTENEGAECLYLIMTTSFIGGAPAIELIPSNYIGDTDGDGLSEILDGWGRPLGFVRWPIGYADPDASIDTSIPDDFDLLRVDFGYIVTGVEAPWSLRPLVISAGQDGEFGVSFNAVDDSSVVKNFSYQSGTDAMLWPVDVANMGTAATGELGGRAAPYIYVDPYLRQFRNANSAELVPGSPLTGTDQEEYRADNLTNYQGASVE